MSENIRECPFCGSRDVSFVDDWYEEGDEHMTVYCNNCHAMLRPEERPRNSNDERYEPGDEEYDDIEYNLIQAWNRRDTTASMSEDLVKLSEALLSECKSLGNEKLSSDFIKNLTKLSDRLQKIKDQMSREKLVIRDEDTSNHIRREIDPLSGVDFSDEAVPPEIVRVVHEPDTRSVAEAPFIRDNGTTAEATAPINLDEIAQDSAVCPAESPWDPPIGHIARNPSGDYPGYGSIYLQRSGESEIRSATSRTDTGRGPDLHVSIPSVSASTAGLHQYSVRDTIPDPYRDMVPTRPAESRSRDEYIRGMIEDAIAENTMRTIVDNAPETEAYAESNPQLSEQAREEVPTEVIQAAIASYQEAMHGTESQPF